MCERCDARHDPEIGRKIYPLNSDRAFVWSGLMWEPDPPWGEPWSMSWTTVLSGLV